MLIYKKGDIIAEGHRYNAVVNPVNCVGVMGAGLAKQYKEAFPDYFKHYADLCQKGWFELGKVHAYPIGKMTPGELTPNWILSFPTKKHWKDQSTIESVSAGLQMVVQIIDALNLKTLAIPAIGAGLGGLSWDDVKDKIDEILGPVTGVMITVYEPL